MLQFKFKTAINTSVKTRKKRAKKKKEKPQTLPSLNVPAFKTRFNQLPDTRQRPAPNSNANHPENANQRDNISNSNFGNAPNNDSNDNINADTISNPMDVDDYNDNNNSININDSNDNNSELYEDNANVNIFMNNDQSHAESGNRRQSIESTTTQDWLINIMDTYPEFCTHLSNPSQSQDDYGHEPHSIPIIVPTIDNPNRSQSRDIYPNEPQSISITYPNVNTVEDLLEFSEFKSHIEQCEFNTEDFCMYVRQIQRNSLYQPSAHGTNRIFPGWNAASRTVRLNQFELVIVDRRELFCSCWLFQRNQMCWHTMLILVSIDQEKYKIPFHFREMSDSDEVRNRNRSNRNRNSTSCAYLIATGMAGARDKMYLVYNRKAIPQIVYRNKDGCISCSQHGTTRSFHCEHIQVLMNKLQIPFEEYKEERQTKRMQQRMGKLEISRSHSYKTVPVPLNMRTQYDDYDAELLKKYDDYRLDPKDGDIYEPQGVTECKNCKESFNDRNNYSVKSSRKTSYLFTLRRAYKCEVYWYVCNLCGEPHYFDGMEIHIFNMNSEKLYTHELMNDKSHYGHWNSHPAMESWRKVRALAYPANGQAFPSAPTFRNAWNTFVVTIQGWKYDFRCPWCPREPEKVCYDGCVIYLQQFQAKECINPTTVHDRQYQVKVRIRPNRYIADATMRKHSQRWLQQRLKKRKRDKDMGNLNDSEYRAMMGYLNTHYPDCKKLIQWINTRATEIRILGWENLFYRNIRSFLRAMTSSEPVTIMMHPQIHHIFLQDLDIYNEDNKYSIQKYSPVIYNLLFDNYEPETEFPLDLIKAVLKDMAKHADKQHQECVTQRAKYEQNRRPTDEEMIQTQDWMRNGSYYSLPKVRNRPLYSIDESKQRDDSELCSKSFAEYEKNTGGVWIIRCLKHWVALGFHVLPKAEGKNDPFSAVYCHWKVAPKIMSGDFNCLLQPYAMKREPKFFEKTVFVVDTTHVKTHTACSDAVDITLFRRCGLAEYRQFRDQSVEQRNRVLQSMKNISRMMTIEQFMIQFRLLLEMDNRRIINND